MYVCMYVCRSTFFSAFLLYRMVLYPVVPYPFNHGSDSPRSVDRGMIERTGANGEIIDVLITDRADVFHQMATTKDQMLTSAPLK